MRAASADLPANGLETLFNQIDQGLAIVEIVYDKGEFIDIVHRKTNAAYERHAGVANVVGRSVFEVFPSLEQHWLRAYKNVALTGVAERLEDYQRGLDRWFDVHFSRLDEAGHFIAVVFKDVTEHKRADIALRESQGRQAFLLELSDALRPLTDAVEIQDTAARRLGLHLGVDRCAYAQIDDTGQFVTVRQDYHVSTLPSVVGRYNIADYGTATLDAVRRGEPYVINDAKIDDRLTDADTQKAYQGMKVQAAVVMPLVKFGRFVALLTLQQNSPRLWTSSDLQLIAEVADRTWAAVERALAEETLRETEERFQQFAKASAAGLWIRDSETLDIEFASPAVGSVYGISIDELLRDVRRWASLIVPDDRDAALQCLEQARAGQSVTHELRILRPSDGAFRWIRNTVFPLVDDGRVKRIGGIAEDITDAKLASEHQGVLLHELQHRVRNTMGMMRSIVARSAIGATSVEDYRQTLDGRMLALARVQALLTREANAGGSLRDIAESEVQVQSLGSHQFELVGPDIRLSPKAVEVLTLAFHELSTNALKYGAFSVPEGRLTVSWSHFEKRGAQWLGIDWVEAGAPLREPSQRRGFGSELIEGRIPYELGGTGKIIMEPGGARCRMEFPLKDAQSILETDAPMPTTTFGGTIDMTGSPDLTGRIVLVVEDDYFVAADTAAALRNAGAEVLGPCPNEQATRGLLESSLPTHALLDLNLGGGGPKFNIAQILKARGIPFILITGYDPDTIPPDLADIPRLQKPVPFRSIVEALSLL